MLLREILHLLLSTVAGLLGSTLLLRMYLVWLRVSRSNPLMVFSVALTNWLVAPLRRPLPMRGRLDAASLAGALAIAVLYVLVTAFIAFGGVWDWYFLLPSVLLLLMRWALYLVMVLVFAYVLLGLVNPHAPLAPTLDVLTRPLLAPLRRFIPPVGGFDLSPLALIVVVQIGLMILDQVRI